MTDTTNTCGEGAELKPCPFCGPSKLRVYNWGVWYVRCTDCDASRFAVSRELAIAEWNTRVVSPTQQAAKPGEGTLRDLIGIEWSYQDDDIHPPRKFNHVRANLGELSTDWIKVGRQEQGVLTLDERAAGEREAIAAVTKSVAALTDPRALTAGGEAVAWVMPGVLPIMRAEGLSGDIMPVADDEFTMPLYASPQPARMPTREEVARVLFDRGRLAGHDADAWETCGDEMQEWLLGHADAILALFTPSAGVETMGEETVSVDRNHAAGLVQRFDTAYASQKGSPDAQMAALANYGEAALNTLRAALKPGEA